MTDTTAPQVSAGIDFGTSNSALALVDADGSTQFAQFDLLGDTTLSYRSLLYFDPEEQSHKGPLQYAAGTSAIESYLEAYGEGRLIQSFKTHLTSEGLGRTHVGMHSLNLDEMVALFLKRLIGHSEQQFGCKLRNIVFGRPVRFAGSESAAQDEKAEARLGAAGRSLGLESVHFELEPIAAAYHYERDLTEDQTILVADFGGGTSDFCVMRLGPTRHHKPDRRDDILSTGGVGVAGDDIDAAIISNVVAPALGKGSKYKSMGRTMPIPGSYYHKLARWHQLSFLKGERTLHELEELHRHAVEPEKLEALLHIVEANQGFHLHKAVESTKISLSKQPITRFDYEDGPIHLHAEVKREDFEQWIAPVVGAISHAVDQTLARAKIAESGIDRVFMTGGTAFVPAVRRIFEDKFGIERLAGGDELVSIASGLAKRAHNVFGPR